jgi:Secretion system C-terminal sorting domain
MKKIYSILLFLGVITNLQSQSLYCITYVPQTVGANTELTVKVSITGTPSSVIMGNCDFGIDFPTPLTLGTLTAANVISLPSGYDVNFIGSGVAGNTAAISLFKNAGNLTLNATPVDILKIIFTGITASSAFTSNTTYTLITEDLNVTALGNGICDLVLPIELQSFTANKKGTKSLLNWQVASEKNLNLYQLERSTDGVIFSNIFEIKPKAYAVNEKVSYDYTDENPLSGINYYRLKALDKNGEYKYSKVVSLDFGKLLRGKAYPNPFDSDISVEMEISKNAGDVFVEIFDMIGKQVYYKKFAAETERMNVPVPTANLTAGTYIIRVKNGANIWQHKIVKN